MFVVSYVRFVMCVCELVMLMTEMVEVFIGRRIGLADFKTMGCTMGVVYSFVDVSCLWIKVFF